MSDAKRSILNFIKTYYEDYGEVPSIRAIYEGLEDVSKRRFYEIFPDGIGEACRQAGVGADMSRIESTKKARKTRRSKTPAARGAPTTAPVFALTESQIARLQGISHLEGGLNTGTIIDRMLDFDTSLRREELHLDDVMEVAGLLKAIRGRGMETGTALERLGRLEAIGLLKLSDGGLDTMVNVALALRLHGIDPGDFVGELKDVRSMASLFLKYKRGALTTAQFKQAVVG